MPRVLLAVTLLACTAALHAHPEIAAALERLNVQIAAAPRDAKLYLERGDLYAKHQEWVSAEANYLCAAEFAPRLAGLDRARGALALATGSLAAARSHLDDALALDPRDAEALIYRSRVRAETHDRGAALADLERALTLVAHPAPELFLERARLHATAAAAIRSLDDAIARIGPALTLHLRALELEESSGRLEAALARLATLTERSERPEAWLKRRGDLLARAGRHTEARDAYQSALAAIAALPEWLRQSPDTRQLATELSSSS